MSTSSIDIPFSVDTSILSILPLSLFYNPNMLNYVKKTSSSSERSSNCCPTFVGTCQVGFRLYLRNLLRLRYRELGLESFIEDCPVRGGWDSTCINLYALYLVLTKVRFNQLTDEDFSLLLRRFIECFYPERKIRNFGYYHWFLHLISLSPNFHALFSPAVNRE